MTCPPLPLHLLVSLAGDRSLDEVIAELAALGFHTEDIFDSLGCVAGRAPAGAIAALRAVPGVLDVGEVSLGEWRPDR